MLLLNAGEGREYNRLSELQKYLMKNEDTVKVYPPFSKVRDALLNNNTRLGKYIPIKSINGIGVTGDKRDLKTEVATGVNNLCTITLAYAKAIGDKDLENGVKYRASTVAHLKDSEVLGLVNGLVGIITPLLSKDDFKIYLITADTLKQLSDDAIAFNDSIGEANIIDAGSSTAAKNIRAIFKDIRGNVEQFSLLINYYKKDYPDFVEGYYKAAAINNTGIHHNGVEGIITSKVTGTPIEGATIVGRGKKKIIQSDLKGAYRLIKIRSGDSKVTISAPG